MKKISFVLLACLSAICFSQPSPRSASQEVVVMKFPSPQTNSNISLEQAIESRRSVRQFTAEPLTVNQIGQLCWSAQGITDPNKGLRTAPSAGALYPIQIYVMLPDGLYLYKPESHDITRLISSDLRKSVSDAAFNQRTIQNAPCTFIIAGSINKIEARYRNRGAKFTYLEAGHIAQNIQLQAVSLGLGSVPIGVLDSKTVVQICKLPGDLEVLYLIPVGNPTVKPVLAPAVAPVPVVQPAAQSNNLTAKRVVIIMPSRRFNDGEFYGVEQALVREGIQPVIASSVIGEIKGMEVVSTQRNIVMSTILIRDLRVDDYDAFVFVGGPGMNEYSNDRNLVALVRSANTKNKILAAISDGPVVFAYAGVVRGRNVTSTPAQRYKLVNAGGNWQRTMLVTDGNLITAGENTSTRDVTSGAGTADRFGTALISALRNKN